MSTATPAASEPSPVDAAVEAYEHTRRLLFPFRFDRWLALGLITFLDQCGRGGISGSVPGGGGRGPVVGGGREGDGGGLDRIAAWLGDNVGLVVGIAAVVIAVVLVLSAIVLWINSRATFVYIEDVASGRTEIARPWKAHAERAWSYFGWRFALMMTVMIGALLLVGLGVAAVFLLRDAGWALVLPLLVLVPLLILLIVGAALLSVALRDFAAPIQIAAGVACGDALRLVWGLARAHPLAFFLYLVLKVCYGIVQGIVLFAAACVTCCCILIPVVTQTFLQPLFFFERAWPLFLLKRMGYDLVTAASPAPPPAIPSPTGGPA